MEAVPLVVVVPWVAVAWVAVAWVVWVAVVWVAVAWVAVAWVAAAWVAADSAADFFSIANAGKKSKNKRGFIAAFFYVQAQLKSQLHYGRSQAKWACINAKTIRDQNYSVCDERSGRAFDWFSAASITVFSSSRITANSGGASIPNRTPPPEILTTVTEILSPIRIFSPTLRLRTSTIKSLSINSSNDNSSVLAAYSVPHFGF
jgi:hypothetical protein